MASNTIYTFLAACLLLYTNTVAAEANPLTQQLARIQQQTGIGAVAYALVENNRILATGGIGTYGVNSVRPVTETSLFRIGSITKTFTSLALMRLVEQGKLQLDEPVKKLAPGLPLHNPWPATPVTSAMLLEHTGQPAAGDRVLQEFATLVAGGIKVALITTATGLAIAIPINIAHNYFVSRVDRIVIDMEESAQKMIDAVHAIERGAA